VFGAVFERGRQAAIAAAEQIGGRILKWVSEPGSHCRTIRPATVFAA
jgi:hypothetical protein